MLPAAWVILAALTQQGSTQPAHYRGYVQAALFASVRPASNQPIHRIAHNLGGSTMALSLAAGGALPHSIGLEGEFVYSGTVAAHQLYNYTTSRDYTAENQQILLNALVRYPVGAGSRLELVAGGGYGRSIDRETSVTEIDSFFRRSAQPDVSVGRNALTLSAGAEVPVRAGDRAAIVPGFRLRWLKAPPQYYSIGSHGSGAWTLEFGVGLRIH